MSTSLQIMPRLQITPLLNIHNPPFDKLYRDSMYWSLFKELYTRPLTDLYLLDNLRATLNETDGWQPVGVLFVNIGFVDAMPDDVRIHTDSSLLERLQELEYYSVEFHEGESTWYYAPGCIIGELSGWLFPATAQDYALREEINRQYWVKSEASRRASATDPSDVVPVVEYTSWCRDAGKTRGSAPHRFLI